MQTYPTRLCYLLLALPLLSPIPATAQTPAPATNTQFLLPLTDATTASATLLPIADGQAYLVYATPTGKLGSYLLTPTSPTPPPEPPIPPPPAPQKLTIAIVEDPPTTTQQQRSVLAAPSWRKLAAEKHDFRGIIPADIREKGTGKPPPSLVPFLDRAKQHPLPWVMLYVQNFTLVWEGPLPATAQELTAIIQKYGG